jgi:(1->4)-alpha-D-glucan 1-alpha-D-glucosylmutase
LKVVLASELNVLANLLGRIALASRYTCDFTLNALRSALGEVIASFPVYRTYVTDAEVSEEDRRYVEQAVAAGKKRSNAADLSVFDFIHRILLIDVYGSEAGWYKQAVLRFAMKFQQVTAAVMAKGVEDTAFYRYNRLISLNEVGGDPSHFGTTVDDFHRANQERLSCWPDSMLSTSTHDSKRSEDVRARVDVLSEKPLIWLLHLRRWRDWNRNKKRVIESQPAPTRNDEYLLYQTLVGTWPTQTLDDPGWNAYADRIEQYMLKAVREAKERTSWANSNSEYEGALSYFIQAVLNRSPQNRFLTDFDLFARRIARIGLFNSLSQTLLKLTSPGVPDVYQGNELLEFDLVDPDNRRPVDYERRQQVFELLPRDAADAQNLTSRVRDLLSSCNGNAAKMYLTWKALTLRRQQPALFQRGSYVPLKAGGEMAEHVVAFARQHDGHTIVIAVPRLCANLMGETHDTVCEDTIWKSAFLEVPSAGVHCYHNHFTGECLPLESEESPRVIASDLFRNFPVAVLVSESLNSAQGCTQK